MIRTSPQVRTTLVYVFFGALWIFLSDKFLNFLIADAETLTHVQTLKGWLYIAVTATLLFLLMKKDYNQLLQKDIEKKKLFYATVQATEHILNNFLNNMMLFQLEAKKSNNFRKEILDLYDRVIDETKSQVKNLSSIDEISEEMIRKTTFPE